MALWEEDEDSKQPGQSDALEELRERVFTNLCGSILIFW